MTFAVGNQEYRNRTAPKPFRDALVAEIKSAPDHKALRLVARSLLKTAQKGNVAAVKEIADRLDGKVPQGIIGDEGGPLVLQVVKYVVDVGPQVIDVTAQSETLPPGHVISNDETCKE